MHSAIGSDAPVDLGIPERGHVLALSAVVVPATLLASPAAPADEHERGRFNCDCDRALVREIDHLMRHGGLSPDLRARALLIRQYFCISPCVRYVRLGNRRIPLPSRNRGCAPP